MNNLPLILSLDTASEYTSAAAMRGELVLATYSGTARVAHGVQLLRCVDEVLRSAQLTLSAVDLLAATIGPGSFTGLRTGLATIKAFAAALKLRVAPVPTLHMVAVAEGTPHTRINVLLPAGRKEVFAQTLALKKTFDVVELNAPRHIAPEVLLDQLDGSDRDVLWVGSGARLYSEQLRLRAQQLGYPFTLAGESASDLGEKRGWHVASSSEKPLAVAVAKVAVKFFERNEVVSADELRALYVRPSDAELKTPNLKKNVEGSICAEI